MLVASMAALLLITSSPLWDQRAEYHKIHQTTADLKETPEFYENRRVMLYGRLYRVEGASPPRYLLLDETGSIFVFVEQEFQDGTPVMVTGVFHDSVVFAEAVQPDSPLPGILSFMGGLIASFVLLQELIIRIRREKG